MKSLKNYRFILLITVLFIFSGLFYILYSDKIKLPNEKWSNEVKLKTYSINDRFEDTNTSDNDLIKHGKNFYLVYFSKNSVFLTKYDENIEEVSTIKLIENIIGLDKLKTEMKDDDIILYFLEKGNFRKTIFDLNGNLKLNKILFSNVDRVTYNNSDYLLYKDESLFLNDTELLEIKNLEEFSFINVEDKYYISFIQYNKENYKYDLILIEFDKEIKKYELINSFALNNTDKIFNSGLSYSNNELNHMLIVYNERTGSFSNYEFKLNSDLSIVDKKNYYSKGYNFSYLTNSNNFIQNIESDIGKIDISTKDEKFDNVALFKNDEKIILTKTKFFPYKAKIYQYGDNYYLIYSKSEKDNKMSIFMSSTDKGIIKKSKKINSDEFKNLFLTTFTTFLPVSFFGLIYAILFLVPFFLVVLPINLINITWAEQNQDKLLLISIVLYLVTKIKYIFFDMQLSNLPVIFTSSYLRVLIGIVFSFVAFYSMKNILDENAHYLKSFFTFFIVDIILFTLYYTPYFLI